MDHEAIAKDIAETILGDADAMGLDAADVWIDSKENYLKRGMHYEVGQPRSKPDEEKVAKLVPKFLDDKIDSPTSNGKTWLPRDAKRMGYGGAGRNDRPNG